MIFVVIIVAFVTGYVVAGAWERFNYRCRQSAQEVELAEDSEKAE